MMSAFDVFLFPSLYEGLPVTLVEAQAAGLPVVCSDVITHEISITSSISFFPLGNAEVWGDNVIKKIKRFGSQSELIQQNGYDINFSVKYLTVFYEKCIK